MPPPHPLRLKLKTIDSSSHFHHDGSAAVAEAVASSKCVDCGVDGVRDVAGVLDYKRGKAACFAALQHEFGLHVDPDGPLVGFIGRPDLQKGVDLLLEVVPHIVANGPRAGCDARIG